MQKFRTPSIKKEIRSLPSYRTGVPVDVVRKRWNLEHIVPLASNENPFGTSPAVQQAIAAATTELWKYSDPASSALREKLALRHKIDSERILIGNGSEELISLLCRACLRTGDRVVTITPSFPLHEIYPAEQGAEVITVPITDRWTFDSSKLITEVKKGCAMLILSNPSNPVGCMLNSGELEQILAATPQNTLVVLDEAYYEYAQEETGYPDSLHILEHADRPWAVLRTFSKAFGMAGARVGYGFFSSQDFTNELNKIRTPFNVNTLAQIGALAALDDQEFEKKTVSYTRRERQRITERLNAAHISHAPSIANFLFVNCGEESVAKAEKLQQQGIIVKPWSSPGFETWLRITIGLQEDNEKVLQLL